MANVYQIAERYRKALAKREAKAVKRLVASYKTVFDALNAEMASILAGAKADSSSVYRARRMATFLAQAEADLSAVAPDAVAVVTAGQSQAVRDAVKAASEQLMAAGVPIGAGIKAAGGIEGFADRAVAAYVGTAGNGSPLTEMFDAVTADGARIAHEEMTKALTLGFGIDRTGEMLRNAIGVSLTRAMTIARTEQMRAYRGAHIGYLREHAEHIAGWVWHADHGWRCCPVCLAMDGSFHELSEDFTSHPNCRCSPISIAKGPDGKPEIPDREAGEQWFAKRSAEEQRMLLGPGKYALYRDRKITLQDLVTEGRDPQWGHYRVEKSLKAVGVRTEQEMVDALIRQIVVLDRPFGVGDIQRIRKHVASVEFSPVPFAKAGSRLNGLEWEGRRLAGSDRLPTGVVHFLSHTVHRKEWPEGISYKDYLRALSDLVLDEQSGMLYHEYHGVGQLMIMGRSGTNRGPEGSDWIVLEYRIGLGHWVTGFQPTENLRLINDRFRMRRKWIVKPT